MLVTLIYDQTCRFSLHGRKHLMGICFTMMSKCRKLQPKQGCWNKSGRVGGWVGMVYHILADKLTLPNQGKDYSPPPEFQTFLRPCKAKEGYRGEDYHLLLLLSEQLHLCFFKDICAFTTHCQIILNILHRSKIIKEYVNQLGLLP